MKQAVKEYFADQFDVFVRNTNAGELLEIFLVSAVASILVIRALLHITGYPQIGGGDYHIAHMLWGGFLMMFAIVGLISFLNKEMKEIGAVVGGIGFGTFIDELGKFITSDNNYFFEPTIALIYVIFILLFLLFRSIERYTVFSRKEYAVNALEMIKDVILEDFDLDEKKRAIHFLRESDPQDPVIQELKKIILQIDALPTPQPGRFTRWRHASRLYYRKLIERRYINQTVLWIFVGVICINFIYSIFDLPTISFVGVGHFVAATLTVFFVIRGVNMLRMHNHLEAYEMYRWAALIMIFFTQFFFFLRDAGTALIGLILSIIILNILQYLIHQETLLKKMR